MNKKPTVMIKGKAYTAEVIDGVRYIDGKTVDEFMKTLPFNDMLGLLMLGHKISKGEIKSGSPQATLSAIEKSNELN